MRKREEPAAAAPAPDAAPAPAAAPVAPEAAPPLPQERDAQRFAALQKQSRQLVHKQMEFQRQVAEREGQLKALQAQLTEQQAKLKAEFDARDAARGNPLKWLEYGGHNYDNLAQQVINQGAPPPELQLSAMQEQLQKRMEEQKAELEGKLQAEKNEREQFVRAEQARIQAENNAVIQRFHEQAVDFVRTNSDKYELTALFKQEHLVPQLIDRHYLETRQSDIEKAQAEGRQPIGRVMDVREAAELVEKYMDDQWEQARASKKIAARLAGTQAPTAPAAAAAAAVAPPEPVTSGQRPTLTNNLASHSSPQGEAHTDEERWKRALAAIDAVAAQRGVRR